MAIGLKPDVTEEGRFVSPDSSSVLLPLVAATALLQASGVTAKVLLTDGPTLTITGDGAGNAAVAYGSTAGGTRFQCQGPDGTIRYFMCAAVA